MYLHALLAAPVALVEAHDGALLALRVDLTYYV